MYDTTKWMLARFIELSVEYYRSTEQLKTDATGHPRFEWRLCYERVGSTLEHLRAFLRSVGADFTPGEVQALFYRLDNDHDGIVSMSDFQLALKPKGLAEPPRTELPKPVYNEVTKSAIGILMGVKPTAARLEPKIVVKPAEKATVTAPEASPVKWFATPEKTAALSSRLLRIPEPL
jgi:hypothetical protein